jgi:hypothetical protein
MSESDSMDEGHLSDMDDTSDEDVEEYHGWQQRQGFTAYRDRKDVAVDRPRPEPVPRNAPPRRNTCFLSYARGWLMLVTYTDLQGEIVVVDLTTEDETPSQQGTVAIPADPAIQVPAAKVYRIERRSLSTMRCLRYYKCCQTWIPRSVPRFLILYVRN